MHPIGGWVCCVVVWVYGCSGFLFLYIHIVGCVLAMLPNVQRRQMYYECGTERDLRWK